MKPNSLLKRILVCLPAITIIFQAFSYINIASAYQKNSAINTTRQINRVLPQPENGSPLDYNTADNFAISSAIILDTQKTPRYTATTKGKIVANIMNYTQNVENIKVVVGENIFEESVSLSLFASVAEQKYFSDGRVLYRKAKTRGKKILSWGDITQMTDKTFTENYGVIPREISKYCVNADSYISGEFIGERNGLFSYKMTLDAPLAYKYAQKELMRYVKVDSPPVFYSSELTFVIDKNWRVKSITSQDYYKIAMMGGVKCSSTLTETFDYSLPIPPRAKPFFDFFK